MPNTPLENAAFADDTARRNERRAFDRQGPRFSIRRWVGITIGLTAIGIIGAFASVALRRTRLDQTTRFWGAEVIHALQLSEQFRLTVPPGGALEWKTESLDGSVDLSDTPGVAHLRHALLDERHYRWETIRQESIESVIQEIPNAEWVTLDFRGTPSGYRRHPPVKPVELKIELSRGWVGVAGATESVQLTERVRSAVRHNLLMFSNVTSKRADVR